MVNGSGGFGVRRVVRDSVLFRNSLPRFLRLDEVMVGLGLTGLDRVEANKFPFGGSWVAFELVGVKPWSGIYNQGGAAAPAPPAQGWRWRMVPGVLEFGGWLGIRFYTETRYLVSYNLTG